MDIIQILKLLDAREIDYRIESNFCCGYIFYFLDGSIYPRRYLDGALESSADMQVVAESADHLIEKSLSYELKKDWRHRIEAESLPMLFNAVEKYLVDNIPSLQIPAPQPAQVSEAELRREAANYAGLMVWVNKNNSDEHFFHEYISSTSYIAGAMRKGANQENAKI